MERKPVVLRLHVYKHGARGGWHGPIFDRWRLIDEAEAALLLLAGAEIEERQCVKGWYGDHTAGNAPFECKHCNGHGKVKVFKQYE